MDTDAHTQPMRQIIAGPACSARPELHSRDAKALGTCGARQPAIWIGLVWLRWLLTMAATE
jgi:hypothetical protein